MLLSIKRKESNRSLSRWPAHEFDFSPVKGDTATMAKVTVLDKYKIEVSKQPGGSYLAVCQDIPGVYAEGKTYLDTVLNIEDVLRISLELLNQPQSSPNPKQKFFLEIPNPLNFGLTA